MKIDFPIKYLQICINIQFCALLFGEYYFKIILKKSGKYVKIVLLKILKDTFMIKQEIKSFVMTYSNEQKSLECSVPFSLYSTLANNGAIANPYKEKNVQKLARYAERGVTFVSRFYVDGCILAKENVDLRISMLDTMAKIRVNGREIATVSDFYLTYSYSVKNILVVGENTLELEFSPVPSAPCRKPRYMYGTQFSPRLLDMGVYGEIALLAYDKGYISNVRLKQEHTDDKVALCVELDTVGDITGGYAVATLESPGGKVYFGAFNKGRAVINVTSPNLWWPAGMGTQNLYRLSVNLYADSDIIDTREVKIGLRDFVYGSGEGGSKTLSINGISYFSRGSTFVPADSVVPFTDKKRVRGILESMVSANCNTVRVSALGYYMPDYFYDYCDELGLVVWQDVAVIGNIADGVDEDRICREIKENILRISRHPCLALVVGAIDEERICLPFTEMDNHSFVELYHSFYDNTVRGFVKDLGVEYSVALPDSFRDGYCSNTSLCDVTDSMSIVSLPDVKTLNEIGDDENINVLSPIMEAHQLARMDNLSFIAHSFNRYLYPTTNETLVYATQQSAAEEIRALVNAARRKNSKCGVLTSQVNDSWYGISQSTVDYFGRWKAGNYMLKREFAPILAIAEQKENDITFYVSNETHEQICGTLHYAVIDNRNIPLLTGDIDVNVERFTTKEVLKKDLSNVFSGNEDECYLLVYVVNGSNILSKSTLMFTKSGETSPVNQKSFKLIKPNIECTIIGSDRDFTLTYKADVYVKNMELSFESADCVFEDNFFDVTDTYSHRVRFRTFEPTSAARLTGELKIKSSYDIGR